MTKAVFLKELAEILEVSPSDLEANPQLSSYQWDSLAQVSVLSMADKHFTKLLPPDRVVKASSVEELWALLQEAT